MGNNYIRDTVFMIFDEEKIVTDKYFLDRGYSKWWVNKHAGAMKAFCRPRRFFLSDIMEHFA